MTTTRTTTRLLIAGGGIGGITAALCLARAGFEVAVFEQARQLGEVGAGIQLSPNCTRVLHNLGLEEPLRSRAFLPQATQFKHWRSGRLIAEHVLGEQITARYGMPYYHIHRGDLLDVLARAAEDTSAVSLHLGQSVQDLVQTDDGVKVTITDGAATTQQVGAALIGADGIHSVVRETLWGRQNPRFTGNVAWRALVPAGRLPAGLIPPTAAVWWGPGKHFVHYYVRGGELINCVCVVEKEGWTTESWTQPGDLSELQQDFSGWHSHIQQLVGGVDKDTLYKWALFDREPMSGWGKGCITLLGDACHPTLPFMAQGAAMAIEDGAVLAGCLKRFGVVDGLSRYEDLRRARTAAIQMGSRRNARVFHLSGVKAWLRDRMAKRAGHRVTDSLYRYNALSVAEQGEMSGAS